MSSAERAWRRAATRYLQQADAALEADDLDAARAGYRRAAERFRRAAASARAGADEAGRRADEAAAEAAERAASCPDHDD